MIGLAIEDGDELDVDTIRSKHRDLGEFARAAQDDAPSTGGLTAREDFAVFLARGAEEGQ